jgi:2-oxoglutarate dehydrogenase E2 component (dihydrolipoamide succinyltransferase)
MLIDVKVPPVGESITEGVLVEWLRRDGDVVSADEGLFVLETDKVTMTINAEHGGRLAIKVQAGEAVKIGQVVGSLDTDVKPEAAAEVPRPSAPPAQAVESPAPPLAVSTPVPQTSGPAMTSPAGLPQARAKLSEMTRTGDFSPAVRRMIDEYRIDPGAIAGTGKDGRITKEDVVRHLEQKPAEKTQAGPAAVAPRASALAPAPQTGRSDSEMRERQTRMPMTPLRARIAERLILAKNSTAMLTTFNEADMTNVLALRARYRDTFKARYGIDLGFMSFFVKAVVDALVAVPEVNAQIQGSEIVQNHYFDIGVAVSSERGLVVPVVRDADRLSFAGVEMAIAELAKRVREKTITLAELSGGVFTVSNGGIYGNLLSTPILNPPQSAILGMHAIKKRPVVVDDQIVIRPMMYLAVSYDHRLVDGREAVTFLKRIVQVIENPERLMLEI